MTSGLVLTTILGLFSLVHTPLIDPDTFVRLKAAPGESYGLDMPEYRCMSLRTARTGKLTMTSLDGLMAHLAGALPAGVLVPIQFVPSLRKVRVDQHAFLLRMTQIAS